MSIRFMLPLCRRKRCLKKFTAKISPSWKRSISIPVSCGKHTGRSTGDHRKWSCRTVLCIHVGRTWICPNTSGARQSNRRAEERCRSFWETGKLNPESNVQLEREAPELFRMESSTHWSKIHPGEIVCVGNLCKIRGTAGDFIRTEAPHRNGYSDPGGKNMRLAICGAGGEVRFHSQVTDIVLDETSLVGVQVNQEEELETDTVIFAVGHSARDTFEMLYEKNLPMQAKSFAVGVRAEHPQKMINASQYGAESVPGLPAAPYKVTAKLENGRGVYSFCMCPGGYVVNASSEEGRLAVNGMSYHARAGENANSAIIVTVTPEDTEVNIRLQEWNFSESSKNVPFEREAEKSRFRDWKISAKIRSALRLET